jgi:uroporphyrinogen III methyltransferase/synthase
VKKSRGFVFLVGAGPGRPDLITLRGAEALSKADAVVVDALADRRLLAHCRPGVKVVDAGKRGDGKTLMRQPEINRVLGRLAARGLTVVRLKGGDPYFFGRGGEEAAYLADRGVPFEVVPGVSSVLAVPSYAGIPLTHRGLTSTVTVVTGHEGLENPYLRESSRERAGRSGPGVAWDQLDPRNTLVILMGVARLAAIAQRLRAAGWPAATPAAVTRWGTLPAQKTLTSTLGDIAAKAAAAGIGAPAVIVLGSVVGMRPALNWFERLPLFGRTVMVTRAAGDAPELTRLLEARGAQVLESPAVHIRPLPVTASGRAFLKDLASYDGVLFTSPHAATLFAAAWKNGPWPDDTKAFAVGPKTARAMVDAGLPVHAVAREFRAEGVSSLLSAPAGRRFLFPRAADGNDALIDALTGCGARVDLWPLYKTTPVKMDPAAKAALLGGRVDAVTFASGSAVDSFMGAFTAAQRKKIFKTTRAVSIGPVTSQAVRAWKVRPRVESPRATLEDMAAALAKEFSR